MNYILLTASSTPSVDDVVIRHLDS